MPEQVTDFEMFHVTRAIGYNSHQPMRIGQLVEVGARHNPFFGYYETPPVFTVRTLEGGVRTLSPIHWLENVRAGGINPDDLPGAAHDIAKHFQMFSRELIMELARIEYQPTAPSRQYCLWASETAEHIHHWRNRLGGEGRVVRLLGNGTIQRADAGLLTVDAEPYSLTVQKARRYWLGEISESPEPEVSNGVED